MSPLLSGATLTVTNLQNSGNGTLRQAIMDANTNANIDTIVFNISGGGGVMTITPTSALPPITSPVIIDGTTQPGYAGVTPLIEINGASAGSVIGLELNGGSNTIKALTINRFHFPGIVIQTNGGNVIERCFVGTDSTGTLPRGNGIASVSDGIAVFSSGNLIGGTTANAGNVISGNGRYGIGLIGRLATGNRIEGNSIGTDFLGLAAVPNRDGIGIQDAPRNVIGGSNLAARNYISGNAEDGIEIAGGNAVGNVLERNFIGLDSTGLAPLRNGRIGILIGTNPLFPGPASDTTIGGKGRGNGICGNGSDGIQMGFGTTSNRVTHNFVGLAQDGSTIVPNGRHGVSIFDSTHNLIVSDSASFNRIVGNLGHGVFIGRGGLNADSVSNRIQGNIIATNGQDGVHINRANGNQIMGNVIGGVFTRDGAPFLGNGRHGVAIFDSANNIVGTATSIGGPDPALWWNNISGNRSNGVFLGKGTPGTGSVSNTVQANQIGNSTMGNGGVGVFVQGSGNTIGGFNEKEGNRIRFNGSNLVQRGHGVVIESGANNAIVGNVFQANAGRAIDLGNDSFTVNDVRDVDTGANDRQNYPVVTRVAFHPTAGFKEITWTLNSQPLRSYYVEFFANAESDPSGFGEGERRLGSTVAVTDTNGMAVFTNTFPLTDSFISATATDKMDRNTSEFSPVDTDGDAIADAWETNGIDFDEDGTNDLALAEADPLHKDIFVEIDAMVGRAPDMNNLSRVLIGSSFPRVASSNGVITVEVSSSGDGFLEAPNALVQNPDGYDGVVLHMELDETYLPLEAWGLAHFDYFDNLKTNFYGTVAQRANFNALKAKKLIYRYCIFADEVPDAGGSVREIGGSDFFVAVGTNSSSPTYDSVVGTFMHELGHSLGLRHGGADNINFKPNYHSIMNYAWNGSRGRNTPWMLDYSREQFAELDEFNLDETVGFGASTNHAGHMVLVGPYRDGTVRIKPKLVSEIGPVDWSEDGETNNVAVQRDINYLTGTTPSVDVLRSSEDWSRLRYYFLDNPHTEGTSSSELTNDLSPAILDAFEKLGTDVGHLQFSAPFYTVNETGGVAVVSVTRVFEVETNVSVSLSIFNGTATNGLDYMATNVVLTFSGAEGSKTVSIPILNDGVAENPESVQLVLSNPTGGATLGSRTQATLFIIDDDPPSRFTVISTNDSGPGSLRQAILDANSATGLALVDFNIPTSSGLTISPGGALPGLTKPMTIDGTTQPGFVGAPIIELNGASTIGDGLVIIAGQCTVRGLVINRFTGNGIKLVDRGRNRIEGCYIGLNRLGTLDQGNSAHGVFIESPENVIGGSTAAARNFISGNNGTGILITSSPFGVATNTQVLGNVIGLGVDGSDQGNSSDGVSISTSKNIIGGITVGERNVISGNNGTGIRIGVGVENRILGNYIGTDLAGRAARGNGGDGITLNSSRHIIGGNHGGAGNVISGNGGWGISLPQGTNMVILGNRIGTDVSGRNALSNLAGGITISGSGHVIGEATQLGANTIAFNNGPGVSGFGAFSARNRIRGNSIFANAALGLDGGTVGVSLNDTNDTDQLQNHPLLSSASNSLTGTIIAGRLNSKPNTNFTIDFYANARADASGNGEGQSWIGATTVTTDGSGSATFTASLPASYLVGRYITATATDGTSNTSEFSPAIFAASSIAGRTFTVENINDSGPGSLRQAILDANAFTGNERDTIEFKIPGFGVQTIRPLSPLPVVDDPVLIDGYTQPGASPNTAFTGHNGVLLIELDGSLAGLGFALRIQGGDSIVRGLVINRFGGTNHRGPLVGGIEISRQAGVRIEGNFIGTDPTGMLDRGNSIVGIHLLGSSNHAIGGVEPAQRNIISGTEHFQFTAVEFRPALGIRLANLTADNRIEGNLIGTAADGVTALGNAGFGIGADSSSAATNTFIGGTLPGSGNVIAFNGIFLTNNSIYGGGIKDPASFRGCPILGNSIHSNVGLGIEGDLINSLEGLGNFPFLSAAFSSNGVTTIQGRLQGRSNALHRIEFFGNDTLDLSSHGEGRFFLGATNVSTDSNGFIAFTAVLPVAVSNGMFLTATATDDRNNTSEFSPRLTVGDVLTNVIVVNSVNEVDDGVADSIHTSLREAIVAANNHPGPDTIRFAIGSGPQTIRTSNSPPAIMDAGTTLDATTQPGFAGQPLIYLFGSYLAPAGFRLYSPSNTIRGFAINGFSACIYGDGTYSSPSGGFNVIQGNYVGTDLAGNAVTPAPGFLQRGIYLLYRCSSNQIGGTSPAARNVVSGNSAVGIQFFLSDGNVVQGNFIGTGPTGTNAVGNGGFGGAGGGISMGGKGNVIGGSSPGARNVIAGNRVSQISGGSEGGVVQGNFIGIDATGQFRLSSSFGPEGFGGGMLIKSNVIVGGVLLGSTNRFEGNFIGTDAAGARALGSGGLSIGGAGNVIGGANPGSRNLIGGAFHGITINGRSNVAQGNFIGTALDGVSPLTNTGNGIVIQESFNQVGGVGPGEGNTIAFSGGSGVLISAGASNAVLGNSIFANTGLGIDLGTAGVTTNDLGDLDLGANNLQNFPILTAAWNLGSTTLIQGTLNSRSNTTYRIEFFINMTCHSSGFGPGRTFLDAGTVTTDPSGQATIAFNHPVGIPIGQFITATATDPGGNTSEFSPCLAVINDPSSVTLSFSGFNPFTLSWPTSAVNFMLEGATNLSPPITWDVISAGITTNSGYNSFIITNDPFSPTRFFRLRRP